MMLGFFGSVGVWVGCLMVVYGCFKWSIVQKIHVISICNTCKLYTVHLDVFKIVKEGFTSNPPPGIRVCEFSMVVFFFHLGENLPACTAPKSWPC